MELSERSKEYLERNVQGTLSLIGEGDGNTRHEIYKQMLSNSVTIILHINSPHIQIRECVRYILDYETNSKEFLF